MRFFDKYMKIIVITGISCFVLSLVFLVLTTATAQITYDESGLVDEITYNYNFQIIYTIFSFTNIACLVWFAVRAITFKMRKKERLLIEKEEALESENNILS